MVDDPIGFTARAYILIPQNSPQKIPNNSVLPYPLDQTSNQSLSLHVVTLWLLLSFVKPHSHAPLWNTMSLCSRLMCQHLIGRLNHSLLLSQCHPFYELMTFSQTIDPFVVFIDSWSYGPLVRWPAPLPYSFIWADVSTGLLNSLQSY